MSMCPYCGETLLGAAVQCSRCGMMLEEEEEAPPEESAQAAKGGAAKSGRAAPVVAEPKKFAPCPKCDRPVPVKGHRCPSCGHLLREVVSEETREQEATFRRNIYLGVGGAALLLVVFVLAVGLLGGGGRPKNIEWAKVKFEELAALVGPSAKGTPERQRNNWLKYGGKWVRWEGRVVDVEKGGLFSDAALLVRHREGTSGGADVRVTLPSAEVEKPGVAAGARVAYTGRLSSYEGDGPAFLLTYGEVQGVR